MFLGAWKFLDVSRETRRFYNNPIVLRETLVVFVVGGGVLGFSFSCWRWMFHVEHGSFSCRENMIQLLKTLMHVTILWRFGKASWMVSSFDLFPIGVDGVTSNSISFHIRMYMEVGLRPLHSWPSVTGFMTVWMFHVKRGWGGCFFSASGLRLGGSFNGVFHVKHG